MLTNIFCCPNFLSPHVQRRLDRLEGSASARRAELPTFKKYQQQVTWIAFADELDKPACTNISSRRNGALLYASFALSSRSTSRSWVKQMPIIRPGSSRNQSKNLRKTCWWLPLHVLVRATLCDVEDVQPCVVSQGMAFLHAPSGHTEMSKQVLGKKRQRW